MSDNVQIFQLQEYDCDEFCCVVESSGELGCGATSTVRLTYHGQLDWVAVKCFTVTGGDRDKERIKEKVQNEYKVLKQAMNHYIVPVHGWVKWPKSVGLVMEYMPGGNLAQFLGNNLRKPFVRFFLRIFCELSAALAFIHDLSTHGRVVHGDLKPENVLLTSELHCKLSDFGSAQMVASTGFTTSESPDPKKLDMTLSYAPPEKLKSLNIKPKKEHDTYSFGMMLYAILSGSPPFQHPSYESAFRESIIGGERPEEESIDELRATLPEHQQQILDALRSIMRKCWAQDPSVRPTMLEVRDELKSLFEQQSEEAIAGEVSEILKIVQVNIPNKDAHHFRPLHEFSPKTGRFDQGAVNYIYSLPNVRQAAFGCDNVNFNGTKAVSSSLSNSIGVAPEFFENYQLSLTNRNYGEATKIKTEVTQLIENNIDTTAKDMVLFGTKLQKEKLFLESILIFDAASTLSKKIENPEEKLQMIKHCVQRMKKTNEAMIEEDADMKVIAKEYVIPLMRFKLRQMEKTPTVKEQYKCLEVSWVHHYIEKSQGRVDQLKEREQTQRKAIKIMDEGFGENKGKHRVYGTLLNNLGVVCHNTSRHDEAASFYRQSIDAKKAAADYRDEEARTRDIKLSVLNLRLAQQKIK